MEKRVLVAAVLSGLVIVLWFTLVAPPPKREPVAAPAPTLTDTGKASQPATVEQVPPAVPAATAAPTVPAPPEARGTDETAIVLESAGLKVTVDPRGAVLRSLVVDGYRDATGKALELVRAGGPLPLSMMAEGPWNRELYTVERGDKEVVLHWSDGSGNWVTKTVRPHGAGRFSLSVSVRSGGLVDRAVVVSNGLAEVDGHGGKNPLAVGNVVVRLDGELERIQTAKLEAEKSLRGAVDFAGIENQYFLVALLPESRAAEVRLRHVDKGLAEVGFTTSSDEVVGVLFAGPKDHAVLSGYGRGLQETISFGIFNFLSVAFLAALKWIHGWAANWGVAIIILTAGIRVLLFPLNHKSAVSMRKMQVLQPKMKAIQDRYQERAKKDPQVRARMNQEVMQLYKTEGVNPMGGCLPLLIQLPILFALYSLFANAIELRQAPFMLWIKDLSIPDTLVSIPLGGWTLPIRPLALLTGASMVWQQKLSPQMGDPAQRKMFMLMPVIFTVMFYSFPAGPTLYWLVNNLFTIAQQVLTEKLMAREAAKA